MHSTWDNTQDSRCLLTEWKRISLIITCDKEEKKRYHHITSCFLLYDTNKWKHNYCAEMHFVSKHFSYTSRNKIFINLKKCINSECSSGHNFSLVVRSSGFHVLILWKVLFFHYFEARKQHLRVSLFSLVVGVTYGLQPYSGA